MTCWALKVFDMVHRMDKGRSVFVALTRSASGVNMPLCFWNVSECRVAKHALIACNQCIKHIPKLVFFSYMCLKSSIITERSSAIVDIA